MCALLLTRGAVSNFLTRPPPPSCVSGGVPFVPQRAATRPSLLTGLKFTSNQNFYQHSAECCVPVLGLLKVKSTFKQKFVMSDPAVSQRASCTALGNGRAGFGGC